MALATNYSKLIDRCKRARQLREVHAQLITSGVFCRVQPLSCKILNKYSSFGQAEDAELAFLQIPEPDAVSWTSMMNVLLQDNRPSEVVSMFCQMNLSGIRADGFAIVGAISAANRTLDVGLGKLLHGMVYRCGVFSESVVNNALIDMYCRNDKFEMGKLVFDKMTNRNTISWSSMLYGYTKYIGLEPAQSFFNQMPQKETECWTVMITGYVQGAQPLQALKLFRRMNLEGHHPNVITIVGILSACADVGAMDLGRAVHGCIFKTIADEDVTVSNALLDMYSKSGWLQIAGELFNGMPVKDIYTWTTMISGYAVHGDGKEAIKVFLQMLSSGTRPNHVTFVSVLLACSHAGLIEEGKHWFNIMSRCYNLKPRIEHYGCMVDLLSRAGLLTEAHLLIEGMGMNPDPVIWRSLLSASLVHGNVELAEIAGKHILKLVPDDDGVYVLLWNLYACSKRWKEALDMRKTMKNRRVVKRPGCSWIEINGIIREFLVDDSADHLRSELYSTLQGMEKAMRICFNAFRFDIEI